jgi:hypothetical protein
LRGVPNPAFASGGGIERDDAPAWGGGVKDSADDEVVGLVFAFFSGVVAPRDGEPVDVGPVDLGERRIERALLVAEIDGPVGVLGR